MMYFCLDCEEYFEEPRMEKEFHSELNGMGGRTYEEYGVCPKCGSEDIEECRDKCDICGAEVHSTKMVGSFDLCPDCYKKLGDILKETVDKIVGELQFDALDAQDLISNFYE